MFRTFFVSGGLDGAREKQVGRWAAVWILSGAERMALW